MRPIRAFVLITIFCCCSASALVASHLRAAEIVAERVNSTRYRITLTVYTDSSSVEDGAGNIPMNEIEITVNGQPNTYPRTAVQSVGNATFENQYTFEYDFPSANAIYKIGFYGINRNGGIRNIRSPSDENPMYVETMVFIDATSTENSTPQLTVPPIDLGNVGQVYTHNPGAYDPDGDSISFKRIVPQLSPISNVPDYRYPDDPSLGQATYTLDPVTGDVEWDAPTLPGEYNIAIMIEEWRNGIRIGYVIRDMQIIIEDSDNERPEIILPLDTCIMATATFIDSIIAFDPNDDLITLEMFGGASEKGAELTQQQILPDSILGVFSWTPTCDMSQEEPYNTIFKAEDDNEVILSTLESWNITVIAAAPQNIRAEPIDSTIKIEWDKYICGSNKVKGIDIYRLDCDSLEIERSPCLSGVLDEWGFTKIATVQPLDSVYIDDNNGFGLARGQRYCYLLVVTFKSPSGGESYASEIACSALEVNVPLIAQASVLVTDSLNGEVLVSWLPPLVLDTSLFLGPYRYELFYGDGINATDFQPLQSFITSQLKDSSYAHVDLNTLSQGYSYRIDLYASNVFVGAATTATTIWAEGEGKNERIDLIWETNSIWHTPDSLYQYIYEVAGFDTMFIDSVSGSEFEFIIDGLTNGDTFCYFVDTRSIFCLDTVLQVLHNQTNLTCAVPLDTVPPCPPILFIVENDCSNFDANKPIQNDLSWINVVDKQCENEEVIDIVNYHLFYRPTLNDEFDTLVVINRPDSLNYLHVDLSTFVGCYKIKAQDAFGNMSGFSNEVCNDNCPYFELPNIFTPNGDNRNEKFIPMPTPRSVKAVEFSVFNRWGKLVYSSTEMPSIEWPGMANDGSKLSDGMYYYRALVEFDLLNTETPKTEYKGWVLLSR